MATGEELQGKGERREEEEQAEEGDWSLLHHLKEKTAAELLNSFPFHKSLLQAANRFS